MALAPFRLEQYFERYEFSVPYLLSSSDAETIGMDELLALADDELAAAWRVAPGGAERLFTLHYAALAR